MQVCGLIYFFDWAQIQTVGFAMIRLFHDPVIVLIFIYLCLVSTKRPVAGQDSSSEIMCFLSEALLLNM